MFELPSGRSLDEQPAKEVEFAEGWMGAFIRMGKKSMDDKDSCTSRSMRV
jgi:hypothetical protein